MLHVKAACTENKRSCVLNDFIYFPASEARIAVEFQMRKAQFEDKYSNRMQGEAHGKEKTHTIQLDLPPKLLFCDTKRWATLTLHTQTQRKLFIQCILLYVSGHVLRVFWLLTHIQTCSRHTIVCSVHRYRFHESRCGPSQSHINKQRVFQFSIDSFFLSFGLLAILFLRSLRFSWEPNWQCAAPLRFGSVHRSCAEAYSLLFVLFNAIQTYVYSINSIFF